MIGVDTTWTRRLRPRSTLDGEQQYFRDVSGAVFANTRFVSKYRSCLINDATHYFRNVQMRGLDVSGDSPEFDWGFQLYNVNELDAEGLLVHDVAKEHGLYLRTFGHNSLRNVIVRNCGSNAAQFAHRALHHGAMECVDPKDFELPGDLELVNWRVENCGLPTGRRPGFAVSFFGPQSEGDVPVPILNERAVFTGIELVHTNGFGAFLAQQVDVIGKGLMVDYDSTDGHPIVQLEKCKSIDIDGDGANLRGGTVKIIEPPAGKTNFRNFTGSVPLVVVDANGKHIHQDLVSNGYQS